jgi:peptidoglycan/xylan/chitin deacetylase (PgdA/CDA1 family)
LSSTQEYQLEFNRRTKVTTKAPLSWDQARDLCRRGHIVGSHTLDHVRLVGLTTPEARRQIESNKKLLEDSLQSPCEYFAWTYGRLSDIDDLSLNIACDTHKYVFSADNFINYFSKSGRALNRRHLEPFWPEVHCRYFLSFKKLHAPS